jgi:hypothetical protein
MRTKIILGLIFLPIFLAGQENYMSLSFGGIIPIGKFGSINDLSENGFALNGFSGDYSGAYYLNKHLGIGANIKYASDAIDEPAAADRLWNDTPMISPDSGVYVFGMGMWNQVSITIGPQLSFSTGKIYLDIFAHGGINFIMPPELSVNVETDNESYSRIFETNSISYGINLGIAIRYHLSDQTSLRIHSSILSSHANGMIRNIFYDGIMETSENISYSCPIKTLNIGIGIVYSLYK